MNKIKNKNNNNSSNIREVDDVKLTPQLAKAGFIKSIGKDIC
jgi:hypothetical protein